MEIRFRNVFAWMILLPLIMMAMTPAAAWAQGAVGETLRIGVGDLPRTLDPPGETSNAGMRVLPNVFETLIRMNPNDNSLLEPALAVEWSRLSDNELELKLRPGVTFHNGDPLTSDDVKFSFERILDPASSFSLARSLLAVIESIETPDPLTVRIKTHQPDPILEYRIASVWGSWIVPERYIKEVGVERFARQPVGTGPFKVVHYAPDRIVLEAYDAYWGNQPHARQLIFREIPEVAARVTALVNDEVDIVTQIPIDQVRVLERYDHVNPLTTTIDNIHVLIYNTVRSPTSDKKLRQAMNLAIDRELLAEVLWDGKAVVPKGHQYPSFGPLYNADRPIPEFNLEKARQLVQESSYNGEVLYYDVNAGYYVNDIEAAEVIVEWWKEIGLNAQVRVIERSQRHLPDYAALTWSNSMRFPHPLGGLWLLWGADSSRQHADDAWTPSDPRFNEIGRLLESTLDPDLAYEYSQLLLDIWEDEAPGTILYYPTETWGINSRVNWTPTRSHVMYFGHDSLSFN